MADDDLARAIADRLNATLAPALREYGEEIGDDSTEILLAGVALAIALLALFATFLQVAQQWFASANGWSSCDRKVMGDWSQSRKRHWRVHELRVEVRYQAPVIFLARNDYEGRGPVKDEDIIKLVGGEASRRESWTTERDVEDKAATKPRHKLMEKFQQKKKESKAARAAKEEIHTADNELTSWVQLLHTLQSLEETSRAWQKAWFEAAVAEGGPPPAINSSNINNNTNNNNNNIANTNNNTNNITTANNAAAAAAAATKHRRPRPDQLATAEQSHTLVVAVQKKSKSWDTMPGNVKKPYATTTWCHMIELTALLGAYWVEFDRTRDRFRAEGNGLMVMGEKVSDLGIVFTIERSGKHNFEENRIIPTEHAKDLAFGRVPTIYKGTQVKDTRRLNSDDWLDISMLNFGSRAEIAESLVLIGCNANTVNYFAQEDNLNKRVAHLFPIPFEIVGMLAKTYHIQHSAFRFLPNPTVYKWNNKSFSLGALLDGFIEQAERLGGPKRKSSPVVKTLLYHARKIRAEMNKESAGGWPTFAQLNLLHKALDDTDVVLTGAKRPPFPREHTDYSISNSKPAANAVAIEPKTWTRSSTKITKEAPGKAAELVKETTPERERRELVQNVLRNHIQEVLSGLNEQPLPSSPGSSTAQQQQSQPQDAESRRPSFNIGVVTNFPGGDPTAAGTPDPVPRFVDIDSASPEDKQAKLMEVYFQVIRVKVLRKTERAVKRRGSTIGRTPAMADSPMTPLSTATSVLPSPGSGLRQRKPGTRSVRSRPIQEEEEEELRQDVDTDGDENDEKASVSDSDAATSADGETIFPACDSDLWGAEVGREDVWCTLVFRMVCWLLLHDFNKSDVQISKSELHGSRLPVYIT